MNFGFVAIFSILIILIILLYTFKSKPLLLFDENGILRNTRILIIFIISVIFWGIFFSFYLFKSFDPLIETNDNLVQIETLDSKEVIF